jgi:hypothetical protein
LWRTPDQTAYCTTKAKPRQTFSLRSKGLADFLRLLFYRTRGTAISGENLNAAVGTLEGRAKFDGSEHLVYCRIAEHAGKVYVDLGNRDWQAVEIGSAGWHVIDEVPIRFRRSRGQLPLPLPVWGGSLEQLRRFVNVGTEQDWRLVVGWLLAALRPSGPYPVLCLHGEQGSAKSTTARVLRALIDPSSAPLRSEPRDARDLIIAATNTWLIALDNLSHLPVWLSDAICRLATGGGFSTRALYTDAEEILFDAQRPCLLNGIEELATRSDLLERSIILNLPSIREDKRRSEADFWPEFELAQPTILGALFDAVAAGLGNLPSVRLDRLPRMADHAKWVTACEPALGWANGAYLAVYSGNIADANELALENSPLTEPLRRFVEARGQWEGSATELLAELVPLAGEDTTRAKDWPKKPQFLSGKLRRLAPNLRRVGVGIEFDREPSRKHGKIIRLTLEKEGKGASKKAQGNQLGETQERQADALSLDADAAVDATVHGCTPLQDAAVAADAEFPDVPGREVLEL